MHYFTFTLGHNIISNCKYLETNAVKPILGLFSLISKLLSPLFVVISNETVNWIDNLQNRDFPGIGME